jgi:hypothetical protein
MHQTGILQDTGPKEMLKQPTGSVAQPGSSSGRRRLIQKIKYRRK